MTRYPAEASVPICRLHPDPEVREAVQEHDRLTQSRPGLNDVKPNASGVDELMFRRQRDHGW
ncbi:hypothetical protein [Mesorhizobium sp. M0119]|uniref:hypothetical protein n=1 Tax=Mesorhizobium sp. M0119 TaxID=2956885 RepID=UPI00333DADBF